MQPGFLRGKQAKGRAKGRGDQLMKFLPAFTVESQGSEISLQNSGDSHTVGNLKNEDNINETIIRMFSF